MAIRLSKGGEQDAPVVLQWLEGEQQRTSMRRRAKWCAIAGWLLISVTAIVSAGVAYHFGQSVQQLLSGQVRTELTAPWTISIVPIGLVAFAVLMVVAGPLAWGLGKVPGFSRTLSAIDWSSSSDAVNRLLTVGCTYPEAFRTAAKVTATAPSRDWLLRAADRVERGGQAVDEAASANSDSVILESLIATSGSEPQQQWQIAAEHFLDVGRRRLVLMLQSTPMISTIIAGIVLWISISLTLGWMWRIAAQMIRGLT
ncbi:MAG: hypothetical protein ACR2NZ_25360 [Rubripirellula sp.]